MLKMKNRTTQRKEVIELVASWFAENEALPIRKWLDILKETGLDKEPYK